MACDYSKPAVIEVGIKVIKESLDAVLVDGSQGFVKNP